MAARNWGGEHLARTLKDAHNDSYEGVLHNEVLCNLEKKSPFYFNTEAFSLSSKNIKQDEGRAVARLQAMLNGPPRIQRWVGVSYHPESELQSHYGKLNLAKCYDQVIFIDETVALLPISRAYINLAAKVKDVENAKAAAAESMPPAQFSVAATNKRLLKEYRRLRRAPLKGIEAHPLERNLLEWHFVLTCSEKPYQNGQYHGALLFPAEYPMRPPAFKVFTPSGRFEPGERLCLSMSDFHPESWNPSWSVETLLVGLQSFMYEESNAIGSISASVSRREKLAANSGLFNARNAIWKELFSEDGGDMDSNDDDDDKEDAHESVCRFCFSSDGELISPCMCKGSNEWIHLSCLRDWQKNVLLTQPTHPSYHTSIDQVCNVCLEVFTGVGIPPSRHEQIVKYTGAEIASMVTPGNLLVSTRESSRENLEIIAQHPEIRDQLLTWTKAVFLMISTGTRASPHLMAVSMSVPLSKGPPKDALALLSSRKQKFWKGKFKNVIHYDSGPMQRGEPLAIAHILGNAQATQLASSYQNVQLVSPAWVVGDFEEILALVARHQQTHQGAVTIRVCWGCGGWGHTQILAEIARGGWGIVSMKDYEKIRPDKNVEIDWPLDFEWMRMISMAKMAPQSEYNLRRR
jgi:ubiquitin-conjugating enzyme E2 J2